MRSIERRFQIETDQDDGASSLIIFTRAVIGQRFTRETITLWFGKLVDKGDYQRRDKDAILEHLVSVSNS